MQRPCVLVVGSGWRFTSGISYYTCRLANAFAEVTTTRVLLMRRLVPRLLYPGRARVGMRVNDLEYAPSIDVYDGVDWFWGRSMLTAVSFLRQPPVDVVVLQWWTGSVLHSYLLLVAIARRRGAKVVLEWHEVQDTGEARLAGAVAYVRVLMRLLLRRVDAHVVHSHYDGERLTALYGLDSAAVRVIPHGPYDHHGGPGAGTEPPVQRGGREDRSVDGPLRLLYFGTIRPYKGVEDLVDAFSALPEGVRERMHLTIVGETWEGWTVPLETVESSPARDRITVVNRYVHDAEVQRYFGEADAVVLPYRRSSASGPLHIAMSCGLPVVVTAVGGLVEAADSYGGAVLVPPGDVARLGAALVELQRLKGRRFPDPHSWDRSVHEYLTVFAQAGATGPRQA